ncbi:hypothetical protein ACN47E_002481 [Coniothyrium glycines]
MQSRHREVLTNTILFFVLTWVSVGLRVYVRAVLRKSWGIDDTFMLVSLGIYTIYLAFQFVSIWHGIGRHRWDLSDHDNRISLMFWYFGELLYVLVSCTLKFSIGFFYLRIAFQRWHIWAIKLLMSGTILFSIVYFFLVLGQCTPISEFWDNHPASDKCIAKGPTLGITYSLAAVNAIADWCLGTLPFFMVRGMNMDFRTKMSVIGILGFAAIGSTGTVVRMFYLHTLLDGPDFLWATTDVAIWSTVEPGIGITAASLATLRPLMRIWFARSSRLASSEQSSRKDIAFARRSRQRGGARGYSHDLALSDLMTTHHEGTISVTTAVTQPVESSIESAPSTTAHVEKT